MHLLFFCGGLALWEHWDMVLSMSVAFISRLANPKVPLPRWVIYLFLHDCLYRQSLYASGWKIVSDYFQESEQQTYMPFAQESCWCRISSQSSCNGGIIYPWIHNPSILICLFIHLFLPSFAPPCTFPLSTAKSD